MDNLNSRRAEDWDRWGYTPRANSDPTEGLKYFNMHRFILEEGQGYSVVDGAVGYTPLTGGIRAWHDLLEAWEWNLAPFFFEWKMRDDFKVVSSARRANPNSSVSPPRDILMSCNAAQWKDSSHHNHINVDAYRQRSERIREQLSEPFVPSPRLGVTQERREELAREEKLRHEKILRASMPQMGEIISEETLKLPFLRVHTLRLVRPIDAKVTFSILGERADYYVTNAQLVVWCESELTRGNEFQWRWHATIFDWKSVSLTSLEMCDSSTKALVSQMTMPVVREFARLVQMAVDVVEPQQGWSGDLSR